MSNAYSRIINYLAIITFGGNRGIRRTKTLPNTQFALGNRKTLPPIGKARTGGFFFEIRTLLIQIFALCVHIRQDTVITA